MNHSFFSREMKMSEVFHANLNLAMIMPRLGIEFGFGEKTIEQCCTQYHVDCDFFLMVCNVYSFAEYLPDEQSLKSLNLDQLLDFLLKSHNYYMQERLPHIENHWKKIVATADESMQKILEKFYIEYSLEVCHHFNYEEEVVFPHIRALLAHQKRNDYSIAQFADIHSNIEDKLADLINIIIKYLPGKLETTDRISILRDINALSNDLNRHALIEDKILIPYVEYLENKCYEKE